MTITARYSGTCSSCGQPIRPGAQINWDKASRSSSHVECPAPRREAPARTYLATVQYGRVSLVVGKGASGEEARAAGHATTRGVELPGGAGMVVDLVRDRVDRPVLSREQLVARLAEIREADKADVNARQRRLARSAEIVIEASTLGLAPGQWPQRLVHRGSNWRLLATLKDAEGEVMAVQYTDEHRLLSVLND